MNVCRTILALTTAIFLCTHAQAQDRGLHNNSKKFVPVPQITSADISNVQEMHRTWISAIIHVPTSKGRSKKMRASALSAWSPRTDGKLPAVVYLHGCSGIWEGTHRRVRMMAELGFVTAAPASMARQKYAQSCDVQTNTGGMHRNVLKMRQNDAAYAVAQLRRLPFVDPNRIVIMGLSEGGITTATLRPQPGEVARIIEGWTCHAGWPEYKGLKAKSSTPVLSLLGKDDPWFQEPYLRGDCSRFMRPNNGSRSVVYNSGVLGAEHELLDHSNPRKEVVRFLSDQGLIQ